jgi:hypothetical protein
MLTMVKGITHVADCCAQSLKGTASVCIPFVFAAGDQGGFSP